MNPNNLSGFDPHVQNQLAQLSLNQREDTTSHSSQSATSSVSQRAQYSTYIHPRGPRYSRTSRDYRTSQPSAPPGLDAFPPLGAPQPRNRGNMHAYHDQTPQSQQSSVSDPSDRSHSAAQEFFARARGRGRGRGNHISNRSSIGITNDYARPVPPSGPRLYNPNQAVHFGNSEQQRVAHQRLMEQSDYLRAVADSWTSNMLSRHEIENKQRFAVRLETLARQVVQLQVQTSEEMKVRLQPYGSLANSFGTAGCDVDLLLTIEPRSGSRIEVSEDIKRGLEKILLDEGIGARLLTNTRIPILRVCENPSTELLQNLRDHREKWEVSVEAKIVTAETHQGFGDLPDLSASQRAEQMVAVANLDSNAATVPLPESPTSENSKLEFIGDCGILCDINFTNHVALINSKLLWTYGQCDPRVRHMGIFVKNWAKARDINTPYRGTLSSYGYILMVLHYLINVANPQLLPNLQMMAKGNGWDETTPELFEGHDVRFTKSLSQIREAMAAMPQNRSSIGALLAGFFRYYGFPQGGFRWNDHVISIRTPGGIVTKHTKEWTRAKWSEANPNVRQRYLLAIEDPFEIDHNVARTVGHHGLCAIRDEFRRAWTIIDNIRCVRTPQGPTWTWQQVEEGLSGTGMDLVETIENRGDLLRKDADGRREKAEKARVMRQELEMQEELARKQALQAESNRESGESNGMWTEGQPPLDLRTGEVEDPTLLIHNLQHQDEKTSRMRSRRPLRTRLDDEENDHFNDDTGNVSQKDEPSYNADEWQGTEPKPESDNTNADDQYMANDPEAPGTGSPYTEDDHKTHLAPASEFDTSSVSAPTSTKSDRLNPAQQSLESNEHSQQWSSHRYASIAGESYRSDQVGEHIEWTKNSKAGVWLLNRDTRIRAGSFKAPTASDAGRLHATFPYDPTMTRTHLSDLNKKLEMFYKTTLYPQKASDCIARFPGVENTYEHLSEGRRTEVVVDVTKNDLKLEKSVKDWPVGEDIPWSGSTDAGRWLLWRDRKIRAGRWVRPGKRWNDLAGKVDDLFPHNAEKTLANIERMNSELEMFFGEIEWPRAEMEISHQDQCVSAIHLAVQNTLRHREPSLVANHTVFDQVYPKERKVRFLDTTSDAPVAAGPHGKEFSEGALEPASEIKQSQIQNISHAELIPWTVKNDVGRWLHWRDAMVQQNAWQPAKDSVYDRLDRLYPHSSDATNSDRERQNRELEAFFQDVVLPERVNHFNSDSAYKALLKVIEHRKDARELERIRSLKSLFENEVLNGLNKNRGKTYSNLQSAKKEVIDERSMRAVHSLSSQLAPSNRFETRPSSDERENLRQKRLAYFLDKIPGSTNEGKSVAADVSERRDSGAEGSWNYPPSPHSSKSPLELSEVSADLEQPMTNQLPILVVGDLVQYDSEAGLVMSNNSVDGCISSTVEPDTWKTEQADRFENPSIIPIIPIVDFRFDPRQLSDIENIKAGGNGCVRGTQSAFMLESDRYSWGGAGAMAQKSNSTLWSWKVEVRCKADVKSDEEIKKIQRLMEELPGNVQL